MTSCVHKRANHLTFSQFPFTSSFVETRFWNISDAKNLFRYVTFTATISSQHPTCLQRKNAAEFFSIQNQYLSTLVHALLHIKKSGKSGHSHSASSKSGSMFKAKFRQVQIFMKQILHKCNFPVIQLKTFSIYNICIVA